MMGLLTARRSNKSSTASTSSTAGSTAGKKPLSKQDLTALKFFAAAQDGDLEKVQKYIRQNRIDIRSALDEYGRTVLHVASEYGRIAMVRYLLHDCQMEVETRDEDGGTALHSACRRNQLRMVQYLLGSTSTTSSSSEDGTDNGHSNANIRAVDHAEHTALHFASYFGYLEIVRVLIQAWPNNVVAAGKEGHTPLHTAAEAGHLDVVRYFIQDCETVDPGVTTHTGMTPLHVASQRGHLPVVKYLVQDAHVPVNATISAGRSGPTTASDLARRAKKMDVVEYLEQRRQLIQLYFMAIEQGKYSSFLKCIRSSSTSSSIQNGGIDVATTTCDHGNMALHVAAASYQPTTTNSTSSSRITGSGSTNKNTNTNNNSSKNNNGYLDIIQYIIQKLHINVDEVTNDSGWTAFHLACATGHIDVVRYLVKIGSDSAADRPHRPVTKNADGDTPLHLASRNGHLDIVRYLVCICRVNIGSTNNHGQTPNDVACLASQETVMEYYGQRQESEDHLFKSAQLGDLDRLKECLKNTEYGIDVTTLNVNQSTVLHFACRYGHLHIVQYLTQRYDETIINVNTRNKDGCTPLHFASSSGHLPIVTYLIEEEDCHLFVDDMTNDGDTAYDLALRFQHFDVSDYLSQIAKLPKPSARSLQQQQQQPSRPSFRTTITTSAGPGTVDNDEGAAQQLDPEIVADRNKLENVINNPTADPTIVGLKYIEFCTNQFTSKLLGEGAFGKVYLGYDHDLNNVQLAVKRIRFDVLDETKMNQIASSFRREISVLKRFRHPNIVILYGYNVQLGQSSQFLVYEYLSNGSLNTYLMDDKGRTRLPSQIRLSIMFQIARSVHFLHTGGCDNLVIYHRDVKSGNICLTKDFTAKLIDCGLAKFVPDGQNAMAPGSVTPTILNDSGGVAFGTPGYMCPIYARGHVPFSAACDVFSIGVVLAELIVGCLQGGRSSRGEQNFGDYFSRYIRDDDDDIIENGWQILMREADDAAEWNSEILELLCKVTVKCMAASPKRRYSTSDLVEELSRISSMNFRWMPDDENVVTQVAEIRRKMSLESATDVYCVLCNRLTCRTCRCPDGHHTCVQCVEQEIQLQVGRSGEGVNCKCGIGFHDTDLYGKITSSTYHFYVRERGTQQVLDRNFSDMKKKLDTIVTMTESNHDAIMKRLTSIDSKIQRVLGGLAYMATNSVQECPTLIWLVPAERSSGSCANAWKQWTKDFGQRRYDLYFVCQHSFEVVDKKLGITVPRAWLVQAAPVLYLSLFLLRIALTVGGLPPLPFPIADMARATQIAMNEDYVEDLFDDACTDSIDAFKTAYTNRSDLPYLESSTLLSSMSASYEGIVKKATSIRKCVWKQTMEPVVNHLGCIIWIKKEYRDLYK